MRTHHGLTLPALLAAVAVTSSPGPRVAAQAPSAAARTQAELQRRPIAIRGRIPLRVERHVEGMPVTLGVPFPKGALASPDHVRLLTHEGRELPAQVTEVTTWEPADRRTKWIWVSFLTGRGEQYQLEYGPDVHRSRDFAALEVVNNQREGGLLEVTTGPMRFVVQQGETGFLKSVALDLEGDGFEDDDLIAEGPAARGSFVDLLDDAGVDASRATVRQTFIERGSGPLHAILRIEGDYRYSRADNNAAPFVMRIHAWAGQPFVRVLHTFVYTGVPDKHRPVVGDYAHLATSKDGVLTPDPSDTGWTVPNDRINASGLLLDLALDADRTATAGLVDGRWWEVGKSRASTRPLRGQAISIAQLGPKPDRIPPVPESSPTERLSGFTAELSSAGSAPEKAERAEGWIDITDRTRGVAIGIRHFIEEYPKEIALDADGQAHAFTWSPRAGAMSFARSSATPGSEGAIENWAQGIAKTSEVVFLFHGAGSARPEGRAYTSADVARTMRALLNPPVAHVDPAWYGRSGVYGHFAPRTAEFPEFQRALDYKFDWVLFNQKWTPWYGMFDYGDVRVNFNGVRWDNWGHNEPAQDYMIWLQFMRTGDPRYFDAAQALSRHTMDVDNTHWPAGPRYLGDTNYPLDYWLTQGAPAATKWLGIGRRHSAQHWQHALSAHVWVQGWLASYYLAADHRALDLAVQTADMHLRRLWGEHELTGRRLYLSAWNLSEVWDATKDPRYGDEAKSRVARMLRLQFEQGGSLALDRYGYAQIYATQGLSRYFSMTGDEDVKAALIRHARFVRDNPPLNHWMESYFSSIHSLALAYEFTGEPSFLAETKKRIATMATDALPRPIGDSWTQAALFEAYEKASHLPADPNRHRPPTGRGRANAPVAENADARRPAAPFGTPRRPGWSPTHGLRIFGWTHAYTLPYALAVLNQQSTKTPARTAAESSSR
jgi:hypothetical protein